MLAGRMAPVTPKCLFYMLWDFKPVGAILRRRVSALDSSFLVKVGLSRFQSLERVENRTKDMWDLLPLDMSLRHAIDMSLCYGLFCLCLDKVARI